MNYEPLSRASRQPVQTLQGGPGHAGSDRSIRGKGSTGRSSERRLVISSRITPGYHLNESGLKHLQHVLTAWFPRAIYRDLTPDTVRVDVIVRKSNIVNRNAYTAAFVKDDGSLIKTISYEEDRLMTAKCPSYDPLRSGYCGTRGDDHFRLVIYNADFG